MDYREYDPDRYFPDRASARRAGEQELARLARLTTIESGHSVLEVGCGCGVVIAALREGGVTEALGVEPDAELAAHGETVLGHSIVRNTWRGHLEASEDTYDRILALDVLEHIPKAHVGELLKLTHDRLNPRGQLILRMPCAATPAALPIYHGDLTHQFMTTPRTLESLLRSAGFTRVKIDEVLPVGGVGAAVNRWVHRWFVRPALGLGYFYFHKEWPPVLTPNMQCVAQKAD